MRLEKINENQIRCILTEDDLLSRKIKLNELSYGSEKARNLFYDMMKQAHVQFGFDSSGSPLMIEAIPTGRSLILNITKVSNPEELDTRFSSFSNPPSSGGETHISGADGILNLLKKIKELSAQTSSPSKTGNKVKSEPKKTGQSDNQPESLMEAFRFCGLDEVIRASKAAGSVVACKNSLYKFDASSYLLIVHSDCEEPESFNRIFNILSEYSVSDHCSEAAENHLREHGYLMIPDRAIQKLAAL